MSRHIQVFPQIKRLKWMAQKGGLKYFIVSFIAIMVFFIALSFQNCEICIFVQGNISTLDNFRSFLTRHRKDLFNNKANIVGNYCHKKRKTLYQHVRVRR